MDENRVKFLVNLNVNIPIYYIRYRSFVYQIVQYFIGELNNCLAQLCAGDYMYNNNNIRVRIVAVNNGAVVSSQNDNLSITFRIEPFPLYCTSYTI